ncbi:hypothetical protein G6F40_015327 [Rhizopus arrhizus]|nr:hypothetical protein G6F40_015327 [Rhizopus arrhizus]
MGSPWTSPRRSAGGAWPGDLAFDADCPGARLQLAGVRGGIALIDAELVVVVVGRHIGQRGLLVHDAERRIGLARQGAGVLSKGAARRPARQTHGGGRQPGAQHQLAPRAPAGLVGDFGRNNIGGLAYQHRGLSGLGPASDGRALRMP